MNQIKKDLEKMQMEWNREDEEEEMRRPIIEDSIYMDRTQGNAGMKNMLDEELKLWGAGQKEYARSPNIFANFTRLGKSLEMPPEKILMVYATKHMDGIMSWINGHKSQREDVRGRINDLRVYLAILYLMVDAYDNTKD